MQVGDKVDFLGMKAEIKYIGPFHAKPGTWVGVELPLPKGKTNGTIKGKKYFECADKHGVFVQEDVFIGAVEKSKQQAAAKSKAFQSSPNINMTPSNKLQPSSSTDNLQQISSPISNSPKMAKSESVVFPPGKMSPFSESSSISQSLLVQSSSESEMQSLDNQASPRLYNSGLSDSSENLSINDDINDLKAQVEFLSQILQGEKQKFDQARSRFTHLEQSHKSKVEQFKQKLDQKLQQITIDSIQKSIQIEEQILENVIHEKELQKITMTSAVRREIEQLQKINDEHNYFEKNLRLISKGFTDNLNSKISMKRSLEKKLSKYQQLVQQNIDNEQKLREDIKNLDHEFEDQRPAEQESKSLKIQLQQLLDIQQNHDFRMKSYQLQQKTTNEFIDLLSPFAKPVFLPILLAKKIYEKVSLIPRSPTAEQLLHFCKISEFFLSSLASQQKINDEFQELIQEFHKIDDEISSTYKEPKADIDLMNRLLQKNVSEPIPQAITKHLIMSTVLSIKDENVKSDLIQIAKQLKDGVIHPSIVSKNRDEVENFAIDLKAELRKVENGQKARFDGFDQRLTIIQLAINQQQQKAQKPQIFIGNVNTNSNTEDDEDPELPELRRRLRDAEALIKTYNRHIISLQQELN